MREAVIVSGTRTPVGAFGGSLKHISAVQLGAAVLRDVVKRAGLRPTIDPAVREMAPAALRDQGPLDIESQTGTWDPALAPVVIDEVIMGNVLQAGQGQNPARQAMIGAGFPKETTAYTVNKICGSGLKAIALGAAAILAGDADVVVAGGQESMSNAPMALPKARWGHRMELTGFGEIQDLMVFDGLYEIFYGYHMGITAENIAAIYGISRREQDELAVLSHSRALQAVKSGLFAQEITTVTQKTRGGEISVTRDERPMETDIGRMSRLRPVFQKNGTVTAGNSSGINDGAAAVLMMSREKARQLGCTPLVKISASAAGGLDPAYMGLGPIPAIRKVLARCRMDIADIDLIELNEAFASQAIGCMRELGIPTQKPNELGSAISLGHPIGATGARQVVSGIHQMQRMNYATGLISICIGGGMGMAMLVERI